MVLRDYFNVLRKNWLIIIVSTLLLLGGAAAWTFTRTPQYEATTQLFVSVRSGDSSAGELTQGSAYAQQAVASYMEIADSAIVLDTVREELDLTESRRELAKRISADSPQGTVLINIRATDPDPQQAALISDTTSAVLAEVITDQLEGVSSESPARVQIDIVQPADVPDAPITPRVWLNLILGLVGGLALGITIALFRNILDTKVRTPEDVTTLTDLPVIGRIGRNPESSSDPLVAFTDPMSPLSEPYRALRTNLRYMMVDGSLNRVVITSATSGDGKSTIAANLAIVMADAGARTLLIDGDLRKPNVAQLFGIEGGVGLSDLLIGSVTQEEVIQQWGPRDVYLLPAGRIPPNPSELLSSEAMKQLLTEVFAAYDYVIIDAPPALSVTDPAILSRLTAGALVVVSAGRTRKGDLTEALGSIAQINGHVLGIIMNRIPKIGTGTYYGSVSE